MTFGAIETEYRGYRFRSRLEARWAVFFDAMGIEYVYETQGFEATTCDGTRVRYLPDFYLPATETWVEVKGMMSAVDASKLGQILDYVSPLPGFNQSDDDRFLARGLLLLGEVPEPQHGLYLHPIVRHRKGLLLRFATFAPDALSVWSNEFLNAASWFTPERERFAQGIDGWTADAEKAERFFSPKAIFLRTHWAYTKTVDAYRAARQARFEHGHVG